MRADSHKKFDHYFRKQCVPTKHHNASMKSNWIYGNELFRVSFGEI
jgi:hypothetical protein